MPDSRNFPYEDFSEIQIPDDLLEKPSMRVVLDALSILRRHVGGKAAVIGKVMGPWTLAYHMAGTQNFLLQVGLGENEMINRMLRQLMPVTIAFARAQFAAGADIVVLADHATGNLVGAYHYEELLLPIHKEMTAEIEGPLILHVCGNCTDRLELFAEAGFDGYHFEWQVDSRTAVEKVGAPFGAGRERQQSPGPFPGDSRGRAKAGSVCHRGGGGYYCPGMRYPACDPAGEPQGDSSVGSRGLLVHFQTLLQLAWRSE